jgi:hypothetical protein
MLEMNSNSVGILTIASNTDNKITWKWVQIEKYSIQTWLLKNIDILNLYTTTDSVLDFSTLPSVTETNISEMSPPFLTS